MDKVVAVEIDMGNERMIKLASEIIMCESELTMSHMIISAVTKCHNTDLHEKLGKLLMKQNDDAFFGSVSKLISDKKEEKRTTALDIIMQISKDKNKTALFSKCISLVKQNENTFAAERILIENILPSEKRKMISLHFIPMKIYTHL